MCFKRYSRICTRPFLHFHASSPRVVTAVQSIYAMRMTARASVTRMNSDGRTDGRTDDRLMDGRSSQRAYWVQLSSHKHTQQVDALSFSLVPLTAALASLVLIDRSTSHNKTSCCLFCGVQEKVDGTRQSPCRQESKQERRNKLSRKDRH